VQYLVFNFLSIWVDIARFATWGKSIKDMQKYGTTRDAVANAGTYYLVR
jgi:hypothetical protein